MMLPDFFVAAALVGAALLLATEVWQWWRPGGPRGALRRRYQSAAPRAPRRGGRLTAQALLVGAATGAIAFLLIGLWPIALAVAALTTGLSAYGLPRWQRRRRLDQARAELQVALGQLVTLLQAGCSPATSLQRWPEAVARALGAERTVLVPELERVRADLDRGATPEEALDALALRLPVDEFRMLAHVVRLCRRRGGDLTLAVSQAAAVLTESLEVRAQMLTLTAGKRAEGLVLLFLPPIMVGLLALTNPQYAAPLIETNAGRLILAVVLLLEAAAFFISRWLLQADF